VRRVEDEWAAASGGQQNRVRPDGRKIVSGAHRASSAGCGNVSFIWLIKPETCTRDFDLSSAERRREAFT
jgi:hypothetical protein